MRSSRVAILLAVLAVLAAVTYFYPPFRLATMVAMGRSPHCPLDRAVQSVSHEQLNISVKDRILAGSRKLEEDGPYTLWQTPKRAYWIAEENPYGVAWNLAEQEIKIYGEGERFVQPGDVVLDCGANVGVFAAEALEAGASQVIAIEPGPQNLECLRRNFKKEIEDGRVVVYPKGVWDRDEVLVLRTTPGNAAADSFVLEQPGSSEGPQIPLTTIDKMVEELGLERVDFIKMDIEGAEQRALIGAKQTLARFRPRLSLASYHVPTDAERIPELVREAWPGYSVECGPCVVANGHIRPDVLYFY